MQTQLASQQLRYQVPHTQPLHVPVPAVLENDQRIIEGEEMSENILDKIDRLGKEAGIQVMTTEIRRFALLVRADMLKEWKKEMQAEEKP